MSNKNRFCPLIDYGPPKGDVWVAVRPAILPYHIEEIGIGEEGKAKLEALTQARNAHDRMMVEERRVNAITAFLGGQGHLLEALKANDIEAIYPPGNDLTLPQHKNTIIGRLKALCKSLWDSANLSE